jgi:hypothetical protein
MGLAEFIAQDAYDPASTERKLRELIPRARGVLAGDRGIQKVEVQVDSGTWTEEPHDTFPYGATGYHSVAATI